jgi:hypothetical protein
MALKEYRVEGFKGIDQSRSENVLDSGFSPDAQNMDTENGDLAVAKGYVKHISVPVPGTGRIRRMYVWRTTNGEKLVVVAGSKVYWWSGAAWEEVYTYTEGISSNEWDFEEIRIGTTDYLVIANGEMQLIKWSGSGAATLFGSGSFVYEGTIAAITHNMSKATAATYAEASGIGTYTLTMPAGLAYALNGELSFVVPSAVISATSIKIKISTTEYIANYVPAWLANDIAVVKLTSGSTCDISQTVYGVTAVTLGTAISEQWKQRTIDVGIQLNGVSSTVSSVDAARTVVTLAEPFTGELAVGNTAKVRGGVSDIACNFTAIHFSRFFAAGDTDHPSRLYWSQPPGDTRSIEDWSADEYSDVASGGFMDVGNTNSDPIIGLQPLSTQLLIFKETSLYRLLGDRPSNFRLSQVNLDVETMSNTGCVAYGDVPYWLTRAGMYYHNGQTAVLSAAARQIRALLADADVSMCKACENRDRLYFTLRRGDGEYDDSIIVFDMTERTYMIRNGFNVVDIASKNGTMYMINDSRYVYRWGEGTSYDGAPIEAYWTTPVTDLSQKSITKTFKALYMRGEGGFVLIELWVGRAKQEIKQEMPENIEDVLKVDLSNGAKTFWMKIMNEAGGYFRLTGGIEIIYEPGGD